MDWPIAPPTEAKMSEDNKIHPIQAMVNGMNAHWQSERAQTQLTLGGLIEILERIGPECLIDGLGHPHSYRGYYSDLAFEQRVEQIKAKDLLYLCKGCMGMIFEGYKGGDFVMGALTPLWIAEYGSCGLRLMGLDVESTPIKLITAEEPPYVPEGRKEAAEEPEGEKE